MAFVSAAAVGVVNRATGPAALAILMQAPQYRLPQKFLLPAGRVGIVWIESMRCIAANDAPWYVLSAARVISMMPSRGSVSQRPRITS